MALNNMLGVRFIANGHLNTRSIEAHWPISLGNAEACPNSYICFAYNSELSAHFVDQELSVGTNKLSIVRWT